MTHKILALLISTSLFTACQTRQEQLPDPGVTTPSIPGELMVPPKRPQPIGTDEQILDNPERGD